MEKKARDWSQVKRVKSPRQVNIRLTAAEMTELDTIAERLGVSKSGYAKSAIFGRPIPRSARRPSKAQADLSQLLGLMGKLGGNANQIARLCNSGTLIDHQEAVAALQGIKRELAAMRAMLMKELDDAP